MKRLPIETTKLLYTNLTAYRYKLERCLIIISLLITITTVQAQTPLSFYARTSIGTSQLWGKHAASDTRIAYKISTGISYELHDLWALQTAIEFVSIGGKDEITGMGRASMNELYLQIPLHIQTKMQVAPSYNISFSAGPYMAIGIGGKTTGELVTDYGTSSELLPQTQAFRLGTFGNIIDHKMGNRRFDAGLSASLAFEVGRLVLGTEVQLGLVKINRQLTQLIEQNGGTPYLPKNLATFFCVGYTF